MRSLDNIGGLCYNVDAVKTDIILISIHIPEVVMDPRKKRVLFLGLSVMLNTVGLFLLHGAFGIIGSVPMAVGIGGFAATAVLSMALCFLAFRN